MKTKNKLGYYCAVFLLAFMLSCEREQVAIENDTVIEEEQYNELNELTVSSSATYEGRSLYNSHHHGVYDETLWDDGLNPYNQELYKYEKYGNRNLKGKVIGTLHAGPRFDSNSLEIRASFNRNLGNYSALNIDLTKVKPIAASSWNFSEKIQSLTVPGGCTCELYEQSENEGGSGGYLKFTNSRIAAKYISSDTKSLSGKSISEVNWRAKRISMYCSYNFADYFVGYAHNKTNYFKASIPIYQYKSLNFRQDPYKNWNRTIESITMDRDFEHDKFYLRATTHDGIPFDFKESYTTLWVRYFATYVNLNNKIQTIQVYRK